MKEKVILQQCEAFAILSIVSTNIIAGFHKINKEQLDKILEILFKGGR